MIHDESTLRALHWWALHEYDQFKALYDDWACGRGGRHATYTSFNAIDFDVEAIMALGHPEYAARELLKYNGSTCTSVSKCGVTLACWVMMCACVQVVCQMHSPRLWSTINANLTIEFSCQ